MQKQQRSRNTIINKESIGNQRDNSKLKIGSADEKNDEQKQTACLSFMHSPLSCNRDKFLRPTRTNAEQKAHKFANIQPVKTGKED